MLTGYNCGQERSAKHCQTFSLSARSKRRRAGRKRAGELAPKLEAAKSHQDGQLSKPPTKTLALRIADPKDDIVRKLASRITDTLVEGELARDLPMIYMSAMLTRSFHGRLNQPRNERGRSICLKAKHSQRAEFLNHSINHSINHLSQSIILSLIITISYRDGHVTALSTHVFNFKLSGKRNHDRRGCLLVLALVFLLIFEKSQATIPIGTTFHTQVFNSGRLVVSQSSPSTVVRRHESHRQPSAPAVKSGRAEQSSLWTSRWKRVIDDDHKQQQRTPTKLINAIAATSSVPVRTPESEDINNDTCNNTIKALDLHPIVCSEQSIDHHHSCYRLHRSVQPWILQTSKKKQHQIQVDETGYILKDPFPFDSYSLIAYKESDRLPDEDINQFLLLFSHV
ncbi:hypothetical protein PSHT_10174 [Puccinia striiformis]|uniref:Uncharacterized protein n=1 Tax=Puccinia striiformis TaxID=27350 RepID=A0A2S4VBH5_9BASI|nr:hypothetical protein PSHT_10174 [Puccinia striiformis]